MLFSTSHSPNIRPYTKANREVKGCSWKFVWSVMLLSKLPLHYPPPPTHTHTHQTNQHVFILHHHLRASATQSIRVRAVSKRASESHSTKGRRLGLFKGAMYLLPGRQPPPLAPPWPRSASHTGDSGMARWDDIIHSAHGNPGGGPGFATARWVDEKWQRWPRWVIHVGFEYRKAHLAAVVLSLCPSPEHCNTVGVKGRERLGWLQIQTGHSFCIVLMLGFHVVKCVKYKLFV